MTVTKNHVKKFTGKLYKFLNEGHNFKFQKMKDMRGHIVTYRNPTTVYIDPRDQIISTLIHETLHYFHPEESEQWILEMEFKIVNKLSERQIRNIIKRWASVI